jgi:hypothetical protein
MLRQRRQLRRRQRAVAEARGLGRQGGVGSGDARDGIGRFAQAGLWLRARAQRQEELLLFRRLALQHLGILQSRLLAAQPLELVFQLRAQRRAASRLLGTRRRVARQRRQPRLQDGQRQRI